jgi:hypothetical protein
MNWLSQARGTVVELPWLRTVVRDCRSREPRYQYRLVSETAWCSWCPT